MALPQHCCVRSGQVPHAGVMDRPIAHRRSFVFDARENLLVNLMRHLAPLNEMFSFFYIER